MHITCVLTLDNGVEASHHEANHVRFELGTNAVHVLVDSWVDTAARSDERPPVVSRMLPLAFDPELVIPSIEAVDGDIAVLVYNSLLAAHFEDGELSI